MRKIFFLITFFAFFLTPSLVFASIKDTGRGIKDEIRTKIQERVESREQKLLELKEKIETRTLQRVASREAKLSLLKQNIVKKYYSNMSERLWASVGRLDTLVLRVETRISVMDNQTDKDLTSVISDVTKAKALLSDTKVLLESSDSMIESVTSSNNPKDAYAILKSNITDIKNNLKEVHTLLVKVIGELMGLKVGSTKVTPSVTVTPTAV